MRGDYLILGYSYLTQIKYYQGSILSFAKLNNLSAHLLMLAGGLLLFVTHTSSAQSDENLENKIKTAYLYNFTKFIEWPEKPGTTFNLCVIGATPLKPILASLENKSVLDKPIRIHYYDSVHQLSNCHIAYFENSAASTSELLQVEQLSNTLTVSSQDRFAESGGMIGFVLEQEKIKLHINIQAIKQKTLLISAKLLEVAILVKVNGDE